MNIFLLVKYFYISIKTTMSLLNIKFERKIIDGIVFLSSLFLAFVVGFFGTLPIGNLATALTLPSIFLLLVIYLHLVIRKGRSYDETAHKVTIILLKSFIYLLNAYVFYNWGSLGQNHFLDIGLQYIAQLTISAIIGTYLLVYRPNK